MHYGNIKDLKNQVKYCLENFEETRNSDITLTIQIWKEFYKEYIKKGQYGDEGIWLKDLYELPREDNVKRARAYWQNSKNMFLPTDPKIAKKRGILEDEWRVAMGYPTKESAGTGQPSWDV